MILMPCSVRAQDSKANWKALNDLRAGEKIELVETSMKKHVGTFSTVTEEAIQMREGSNDIGIPKAGVARVTVLDKSYRLRNSFIFGTVGAGAGAGIATAATRPSIIARGAVVAVGAMVGLVGGAGVGAAIPSHPTIYRAEPKKVEHSASTHEPNTPQESQ
jgi:thiamine pyrophosphate-dependent acetolactate synthase large subunit-like protein